ncbi:MAG: flagellar filament capping protein FliD [Candidatus Muiribacteriota bacterium]
MSMQITGLASGLDVNNMIEQLMEIEKRPLNKMVDSRNDLELKKEMISEANMKIFDFQNDAFEFTMQGSFRNKTVNSSNENVITANAGVDAPVGSYEFEDITRATSTKVSSSESLTNFEAVSSSTDIGAIDITKSFSEAGFVIEPSGTVTVNGVNFNLDHYSSVQNFMTAVENNSGTDIDEFKFNTTTNMFSIIASTGSTVNMFESGDGTGFLTASNIPFVSENVNISNLPLENEITGGVFSINGVDFIVDEEKDTIKSVVKRINESNAGVNAFFDENTEKLSFSAKEEGTNEIVFEDKSTNFLEGMNVLNAAQNTGTNATFKFNGIETQRSSNSFELNGVNFNLNSSGAGPVTVNVENDTEGVADNVEEFVEKYNETMKFLYNKLNEEAVDEAELESAQTMEEFRELSKQGLLKRDTTLRQIQDQMKNYFAISFGGLTMGDLGLEAAGEPGVVSDEMEIGIINFNKDKFEQKLNEDPEMIESMFRNDGNVLNFKNREIGTGDGVRTNFRFGHKNIGQNIEVEVDGEKFKLVTEPENPGEFSVNRTTGHIDFFEAPEDDAVIKATFDVLEGDSFSENERSLGEGNGYRTNFRIGNRNAGQDISLIVGDGSVEYNQVESKDELTGNTYFVDRETGTLSFAEAPEMGKEVRASYNYTITQPGMFNEIYESLSAYTGVGILYQNESSINSQIKTADENIASFQRRMENVEQRLLRQFTNLEVTMNDMQSQSSWLEGQLNKLM